MNLFHLESNYFITNLAKLKTLENTTENLFKFKYLKQIN